MFVSDSVYDVFIWEHEKCICFNLEETLSSAIREKDVCKHVFHWLKAVTCSLVQSLGWFCS